MICDNKNFYYATILMRMTDNSNIGEANKYRAEILYSMEVCYQLKFDYCGISMLIIILFVLTKKNNNKRYS